MSIPNPKINDSVLEYDTFQTAEIQEVTKQLAHKANYNDLVSTDQRVNDVNGRIDQIITTPAEGISEQEIIDSRQGEPSLGANLESIKDRLGVLNLPLTNFVTNGNMETLSEYEARNSTHSLSNNVITNSGDGSSGVPWIRKTTSLPLDTVKKVYIKVKVRVTSNDVVRINLGALNSMMVFMGESAISFPIMNQWYEHSLLVTTKENDSGNLSIGLQHHYPNASSSNGKSLEVQYVLAMNLTEIFGENNEPTKNDIDKIMDHFQNRWFNGTIGADKTQKALFNYLLSDTGITTDTLEKANEYTDLKISEIPKNEKELAIEINEYDKRIWFDFEDDLWEPYLEGQVSVDTENVRYGSRAMRITKTSSSPVYAQKSFTSIDLSKKMIVFSLYISEIEKLDILRISLRTGGSNWINGLVSEYHNDVHKRSLHQGWNYFVLDPTTLVALGTGTLDSINNVTGIRIAPSGSSQDGIFITLDAIFLVDKPVMDKPIITITFDDGFATDYTQARKIMTKYGYLGTSYIIPSHIGSNRYMTLEQLNILYDMGWDISNHTMTHPMLNVTDEQVWIQDTEQGYQWLMDNGFVRSAGHIAYPGGYNNKNTLRAIEKKHKSGRINIGTTQPIPVGHKYQLQGLNGASKLDYVKSNIDKVLARGQWLILMFHEISDNPSDYGSACSPAHFQEVIEYLYEKQANVLPMSKVIA